MNAVCSPGELHLPAAEKLCREEISWEKTECLKATLQQMLEGC